MTISKRYCPLVLVTLLSTACGEPEPAPPPPAADPSLPVATAESPPPTTRSEPATERPVQAVFWDALTTMCGQQFAGQLTVGTEESDRDFGYAELRIDALRCETDAVDIQLAVDDDASRTWMIRRIDSGFSLHHRHVDETGKEDDTSGYGGFTADTGTATRQTFPADENTGQMIPAAATNVWAIEVVPEKTFTYELRRDEDQRQFRVVFDLSSPLQ